jgi:hypothetical protein
MVFYLRNERPNSVPAKWGSVLLEGVLSFVEFVILHMSCMKERSQPGQTLSHLIWDGYRYKEFV